MLEQIDGLIPSLNVSRVGGGVHGHKAIISFLFLVSTVDRGALRGKQRTKPFSANSTCAKSVRTGGVLRMQQCSRAAPADQRWLLRTYRSERQNAWSMREETHKDASCSPYGFSLLSPAPEPASGVVIIPLYSGTSDNGPSQ